MCEWGSGTIRNGRVGSIPSVLSHSSDRPAIGVAHQPVGRAKGMGRCNLIGWMGGALATVRFQPAFEERIDPLDSIEGVVCITVSVYDNNRASREFCLVFRALSRQGSRGFPGRVLCRCASIWCCLCSVVGPNYPTLHWVSRGWFVAAGVCVCVSRVQIQRCFSRIVRVGTTQLRQVDGVRDFF